MVDRWLHVRRADRWMRGVCLLAIVMLIVALFQGDQNPDKIPGDAKHAQIADNGMVITFLSRGKIVAMKNGKIVASLPVQTKGDPILRISDNGEKILAYCINEEGVLVWNLKREEYVPIALKNAAVNSYYFAVGDGAIVAVTKDGEAHIYNSTTGELMEESTVAAR